MVAQVISNDFAGLSIARRRTINEAVLSHPNDSYVFNGPAGIGKTTLMREIFRLTSRHSKWTDAMKWRRDMIAHSRHEYRFDDGRWRGMIGPPPISAEGLESRKGLGVFFDEIDKLTGTEFVANEFHALLDEIIKGDHQLVMTTNLSRDMFREKFGDSIYWRIFTAKPSGCACKWVSFTESTA